MRFKLLTSILLTALLTIGIQLSAQNTQIINQLSRQLMSGEISQAQAIKMAREAGVSQQDIEAFQEQQNKAQSQDQSEIDEAAAPQFSTKEAATPKQQNTKKDTTKAKAPSLEYFGYQLFSGPENKYNRLDIGTIDPGYQIGPGDEIILSIWGQVERRSKLKVSREGTIFIEQYGQMVVSGLTLEQLEKKVKRNLSRIYSGLGGAGGTYLDVSLGELRSILVYVIGDVENSGSHFVSNYSTAFTALHKAGGATNKGSLRNIQVIRNNKVIATLDLYNFIRSGKLPGDIRLQNNDVVYVPPRLSTVSLKGKVKQAAIFELKNDETLDNLISFSGGIDKDADINQVQIERILPFNERNESAEVYRVLTPSLKSDSAEDFRINPVQIEDRDIVTVMPLTGSKEYKRVPGGISYVHVSGHIYKPGRYVLTENMTISSLLSKAGGLKDSVFWSETYQLRADLIRYTGENMERKVIGIPLQEYVERNESATRIRLENRDSLIIYSAKVAHNSKLVSIQGEVRKPGNYVLHNGMTTKDLLLQAGGYTKSALKTRIEIFRLKSSGDVQTKVIIDETTDRFLLDESQTGMELEDYDLIVIRKNPDFEYHEVVYLGGEVKYPGQYPIIKARENLKSLVERAGGFTEEAFVPGVKYIRDSNQVVGDFTEALLEAKSEIILQSGDSIIVPRHPSTVQVTGNVRRPGLVQYNKRWNLEDYVEAAGDYDFDAAKGKTVVYYPGGYAKRKHWFSRPKVEEGSVIFVPEKPEREPVDVTRVISEWASIATSVVLIIYLTK